MRFFNTAGPVRPDLHYCLPPLERLDLAEVLMLIDQHKYFVLHAPRQTGKTSFLLALMETLNRQGRYRCLYVNVEGAQAAREDVAAAMQAILYEIALKAQSTLADPYPESVWQEVLASGGAYAALNGLLARWAAASPQPLVLLIDEIDSLVGDTLISVLRQLRAGYAQRPRDFPQSVILCGVRDVRDYRLRTDEGKALITGGSAFNIKAESLRLGDFLQSEVEVLYAQHTAETGQAFEPGALDQVWQLTRGQPWLVNALGYETCFKMKAGRDRSQPITAATMLEAKEQLILRRETHLDQLIDKLQEARVRRVLGPMLQGESLERAVSQDDVQYVVDLGMVRRGRAGLEVANPIYREVIPRELGFIVQLDLESTFQPAWYITPHGRLDVDKLLTAFQQFFREHSEHWVERFDYREAGPQLLLQAFLQRIVNSGGRIEREYGLGRKRTD
ncbi:MAG: ATP-binding protein, partial [Chloroflexi bacterium]|nr:ATP-binding protein [Chloroflexota bacterium]